MDQRELREYYKDHLGNELIIEYLDKNKIEGYFTFSNQNERIHSAFSGIKSIFKENANFCFYIKKILENRIAYINYAVNGETNKIKKSINLIILEYNHEGVAKKSSNIILTKIKRNGNYHQSINHEFMNN